MAAHQHGNKVELLQLEPQPVVSIRGIAQTAALGEAQDERLRALSDFLQQHGVQPGGPPFVRYHTFGDSETDFEIGVPVLEPAAGEGRVVAGELPGGPAIATWHYGAHNSLGDAYARLAAWQQEHQREPDGAGWEVYYWIDPAQYRGTSNWPEPSAWRTQLAQPIN